MQEEQRATRAYFAQGRANVFRAHGCVIGRNGVADEKGGRETLGWKTFTHLSCVWHCSLCTFPEAMFVLATFGEGGTRIKANAAISLSLSHVRTIRWERKHRVEIELS